MRRNDRLETGKPGGSPAVNGHGGASLALSDAVPQERRGNPPGASTATPCPEGRQSSPGRAAEPPAGGPATAGGARQASPAGPPPFKASEAPPSLATPYHRQASRRRAKEGNKVAQEGRQSRPVAARSLGVPSAGFATTIAIRTVGACIVTAVGFFSPGVPLWAAGLTMLIAIVTGLRSYRTIAMASFLLWPAVLCATGLVAIGFHPVPVWVVAAIVVIGLTALSALTGVAILAVIVTLIAVFPASPVLVLADAMPGTGLIGASAPLTAGGSAALPGTASLRLPVGNPPEVGASGLVGPIVVMLCLAIVEWLPGRRTEDLLHRAGIAAMIIGGVVVWNLAMTAHPDASISGSEPAAAANTIWQEMDEPRAVTERGRWIALRDMLPEGGEAIFGENFFRADDQDAIAFWCEAARQQNLTLWIGVRVDRNAIRRGAVMRFDPQSCALPDAAPPIVHAAQWGIPGITGTWGRMEPLSGHSAGQAGDREANDGLDDKGPASAWLICYEAFLVPAWAEALSQAATGQPPDNRPIIVLSNDGAFGALPVSRLRRKVTRAMAGLTGTIVLHADTGRTFLLRAGPAAISHA